MKKHIIEWPIQNIKVVKGFYNLDVDIYEQTYGALSQDDENPLSRIAVANSGFSIDACRGCPLGCAYCVTGSSKRDLNLNQNPKNICDLFIKKPQVIFQGRKLISTLVGHPAFIKDKSIISIATASSEAFIGKNSGETWSILKYLMEKGYKNPIWIVTKIGIPPAHRKVWNERLTKVVSSGIKVIISISYSGLPVEIEPYQGDRFEFVKHIKESGVYFSHHLRPVIRNVNDDEATIEKCLDKSLPYVKSICIGGLRLDPGIILAWKHAKGLPTGILPSKKGVKDIPKDYLDKVNRILRKKGVKMPVFQKSSEVIGDALGYSKDYNLGDYRTDEHGVLIKIPKSKFDEIRNQTGREVVEIIKQTAAEIGLDKLTIQQKDSKIVVKQKLNYQEEKALIHAIGHKQLI